MSRMRLSSRRASLLFALLGSLGAFVPAAVAAPTPLVDLGQATSYAVLSGASVGNTVNAPLAPHTTLRGDLGVKADAQPTGFPPGVVTGVTRIGTTAAQAHTDLVAAYSEVAARPGGTALAGQLNGVTLAPGLHSTAAAVSNTGNVTLDGGGNPDAVFVFKIGGALTMAVGAQVILANGTRASRVFWQVNGAAAVGANAKFAGTLMALDAVAMGAGTLVNGRALARNGAVSLDSNEFYSVPPAVTIAGGSTAITTDTTPTISGTTDVEAPGAVTVTVGGQTLNAVPSEEGAWSVTSALLANGSYPVTASVTDGAGNPGSAAQQLTVDTVLPVVAFDGEDARTTNDATPTLGGTTDVAPGSVVRVTLDDQLLTTLVQADGTWNATPAALADGSRTVTVTVEDPAGNDGTDTLMLTIDTSAPAVTIGGGATALTNDATPAISGTAAVPAGSTVRVDLADETLYASTDDGGAWTVTAAALADGPHRVVMSVADGAGNVATTIQTLTVDTVSPLVTITGGQTATTNDLAPTLTGTSNAAPGTTVTVTIAGQTLTTLLQSDGTWNATPNAVGEGTWTVVASAPDPAGNVGTAQQTLTTTTGALPAPPAPTPVAPGETPPAPVVSPVDLVAVAPSTVQKVGVVFAIGTTVTAPPDGFVRATATGVVRIKGVRRAIVLTSRTATIPSGQTLTLKIKPKGSKRVAAAALRRIRLAIRRGKKVTATITVRLVDAAGETRTVKRTVRLTR